MSGIVQNSARDSTSGRDYLGRHTTAMHFVPIYPRSMPQRRRTDNDSRKRQDFGSRSEKTYVQILRVSLWMVNMLSNVSRRGQSDL